MSPSDIKLPTREETENLINTVSEEAEYLFDGWGSKFRLQDFTETTPGTYYPDEGYLGFKSVTLPVPEPGPISLQDKTVSTNGVYTADDGYDGLGIVTVSVVPLLQNKTFTSNGTYTADVGYDGLGEIIVSVSGTEPILQDKTVTINGTYTADEGYDGLGEVTVNVSGGDPTPEFPTLVKAELDFDSISDLSEQATIWFETDSDLSKLTEIKYSSIILAKWDHDNVDPDDPDNPDPVFKFEWLHHELDTSKIGENKIGFIISWDEEDEEGNRLPVTYAQLKENIEKTLAYRYNTEAGELLDTNFIGYTNADIDADPDEYTPYIIMNPEAQHIPFMSLMQVTQYPYSLTKSAAAKALNLTLTWPVNVKLTKPNA